MLKKLRAFLALLNRTRSPEAIFHRLAALPLNEGEAIAMMQVNRTLNDHFQSGFYRDNLVVLATLEKSASTLHEATINQMLSHTKGLAIICPTPRQNLAGPSQAGGGAAFNFTMLQFVPNGGTLRGVYLPNRQNFWLLGELGSKVVILTRHPADRIVAQYCMRKRELDDYAARSGAQTPFHIAFLGDDVPLSIDSLEDNLRWIAGWKRRALRDPNIVLVRYEEMVADPLQHFASIHRFLFGTGLSKAAEAAVKETIAQSGEGGRLQPGDKASRVYEHGYSGKVGVWRDYLNPDAVAAFNEAVNRFFLSEPRLSEALTAVYPDILLESTEVRQTAAGGGT